jgi:hypothetical protein
VTTHRTFRNGWVWRCLSRLTSPRFYLWGLAVLLTSGLVLRGEAAIRGRQITSAVTALSILRIGETSKAETLSRIPRLRPFATGSLGAPHCDADECFYMAEGNSLLGNLLWRTENSTLSWLLRWCGFRFENLGIWVKFTSGRVSYFSYELMVSAPGVFPRSVPLHHRTGNSAQ